MSPKIPTEKHQQRGLLCIAGIAFGALVLIAGILNVAGIRIYGNPDLMWPHFVVIGLILLTGSEGLHRRRRTRRREDLEARMPDFLRHLATSRASGLTLAASVHSARDGDYGPLKPEVQRMSSQLRFNAAPQDVFGAFAERSGSHMVRRVVALLQDAIQSGGRTSAALQAAAREAETLQELREARTNQLWVYVSIVYVAFAIFTFVMIVLSNYFLDPIFGAEGTVGRGLISQSLSMSGLLNRFEVMFLWGITVSGLGSGLAVGSIVRGNPLTGLHHCALLMLAGYLLFGSTSLW